MKNSFHEKIAIIEISPKRNTFLEGFIIYVNFYLYFAKDLFERQSEGERMREREGKRETKFSNHWCILLKILKSQGRVRPKPGPIQVSHVVGPSLSSFLDTLAGEWI